MSSARYRVTGIVADSFEQVVVHFHGAPGDGQIAGRLRNKCHPKQVVMATRYFPSKKAWLLLDLRKAVLTGSVRNATARWWVGIKRYPRFLPSEDAAIMVGMHLLNLPQQEEFDL